MSLNRALFTSSLETWRTPEDVYAALDREFQFTLDPCPARKPSEAGLPLLGTDGLNRWWHQYALKAEEIRFVRGRLRFNGATAGALFPRALLICRQSGELMDQRRGGESRDG